MSRAWQVATTHKWRLPHPRHQDVRIVPIGPSRLSASSPSHSEDHADGNSRVFAVRLAPIAHEIAWVGFSLFHVVCAGYLIVAGLVFQGLPGHDDMFYIDYYAVALHSRHFYLIAIVHFGLAVVHGFLLGRPLLIRLWEEFALHRGASVSLKRRRPWILKRILKRVSRVFEAVSSVYWFLFARTGLFGVQGRYYEVFFTVNEVLDIVLQTIQAVQLSQQSSHRSLNRFYAATLFLNCVTTPLVHVLVVHKPLQRLLCRLADIVLDFLVTVVVPLALAQRFYAQYDPATRTVPSDLWYTDVWFIQTLKEAPIVLFGSWFDALSRFAFSVGLIMSLNSVKNLLRPVVKRSTAVMDRTMTHSRPARPDFVPRSVLRLVHGLMVAFGIVVLGVHLHAETRPSPPACVLEVRPWLATQPACALIEFNCFKNRTLSGSASDFDAVFGSLYTPSLLHIVYRHCPHVEVGPVLKEFHELVGFKTYNSTIITWSDAAALSQTQHPHIRFAFFVVTNFSDSELPLGLRSRDFPQELRDIEISVSNLQGLPNDLHEFCPSGATIVIEFSRLSSVPPSLLRLNAYSIRLDGNEIRKLPLEALLLPDSIITSFSGNPIESLPETADPIDLPALSGRFLLFTSTLLTSLPAWMASPEFLHSQTIVIAKDTPLCRSLPGPLASASETGKPPPWAKSVRCIDSQPIGYYPLHVDQRASETDWA